MKTPAPPPDTDELIRALIDDRRFLEVIRAGEVSARQAYLPWDKLRYKTPPDGLSVEEWWLSLKLARRGSARSLPQLLTKEGQPFVFNLPDPLLRLADQISRQASGSISISEQVTNPNTRDRYIISSLIEEAITSSQLEGASTSHHVAKDMLRSGREPRDHSERMILNNFRAMQHIVDLQAEILTPDLVREIHRIVTDGTLENADDAGRIQTDDGERIAVWAENAQLLHRPPPVAELEDRLNRLCAFANGDEEVGGFYIPPVLRAIAVHFMAGYDHYFVDGNGRTARALFYWTMLRHGYWLTEFLTISTILRKAPAQYVRSFLLTEQDDADLTYFFLYHCEVITRAIDALNDYLARKAEEVRRLHLHMSSTLREFNHRQVAVLEHAIKNPGASFTAKSHSRSHGVTTQTARSDLMQLESQGLLIHTTRRRELVWTAVADVADRLA